MLVLLAAFILVFALAGCGDSGSGDSSSPQDGTQTAPAKPENFTATAGNGKVILSWTTPDDGGSPITKYEYSYSETSAYLQIWDPMPGSGASTTSYTVGSLTNGTSYTFEVRAINAKGESPSSGTKEVTPSATSPTVSTVTVSAAGNATSVAKGGTLLFSAGVTGTNSPGQDVTWTITTAGKHADTSISTGGLLAVNAAETQSSLTIRATSDADPSKYGEKSVTVSGAAAAFSWTAKTATPGFSAQLNGVAWGNNKFITGGEYINTLSSDNGESWSQVTGGNRPFASEADASQIDIKKILWTGDKFTAVETNRIAQSATGTGGWTTVSTLQFDKSNKVIADIVWIGPSGHEKFFVISNGELWYYDGSAWQQSSGVPTDGEELCGIAWGGGTYAAVSTAGSIWTSSTGIDTWTKSLNQSQDLRPSGVYDMPVIAYGGGKFVAGTKFWAMVYSSDGTTWSTANGYDNTNKINSIAYGGGKYVAVGNQSIMAQSDDGINWTLLTESSGTWNGNEIFEVIYGNGRFVAVGRNGYLGYSNIISTQ